MRRILGQPATRGVRHFKPDQYRKAPCSHAATPGGGLVERVGETSQPAVHRGLEIGVLDAGEG